MKKGLAVILASVLSLGSLVGSEAASSYHKEFRTEKVNKHVVRNDSNYKQEFMKILKNPERYNIGNIKSVMISPKKCKFLYSLYDIDRDNIPELIMMAEAVEENNMIYASIYKYSNGRVYRIVDGDYMDGVASVGGYRGGIVKTKSNTGLIRSELSSGTGEYSISKLTISKNKKGNGFYLKEIARYEGRMDQDNSNNKLKNDIGKEFDVYPVSNLGILNQYGNKGKTTQKKSPTNKVSHKNKNVNKNSISKKTKVSGKKIDKKKVKVNKPAVNKYNGRLEGKLLLLNRQQLLRLQKISEPNPGTVDNSLYVILKLNKPTNSYGVNYAGDMIYGKGIKLVSIIDDNNNVSKVRNKYSKYNNKNVVIEYNTKKFNFPSDTGLPLGEPIVIINNIKLK